MLKHVPNFTDLVPETIKLILAICIFIVIISYAQFQNLLVHTYLRVPPPLDCGAVVDCKTVSCFLKISKEIGKV